MKLIRELLLNLLSFLFFWSLSFIFFKYLFENYLIDEKLLNSNSLILEAISILIIVTFFVLMRLKIFFSPKILGFAFAIILVFKAHVKDFEKYEFYSNAFINFYSLLNPYIVYSFIAIFLILVIKKFFFSGSQAKDTKNEGEYSSPIEPKNATEQQREKAIHILKFIKKTAKQKRAVNIGIVGGWGSGKTTILEILKKYVNPENLDDKETFAVEAKQFKDNFLLCEFNPFLYGESKSITKRFLETISLFFKKELSLDIFISYSQFINSISDIHPIYGVLSNLVSTNNDIELFSNISKKTNNVLNKLKKKVIFIIDDLDRLKPTELYEILRLINITSSFSDFYFIFAYDRKFIDNSFVQLLNFKDNDGENFFEKFIHREFILPEPSLKQICDLLKKEIKNLLLDPNWNPKTLNNENESNESKENFCNKTIDELKLEPNDIRSRYEEEFQQFMTSFRQIKSIALHFVSVYIHLYRYEITALDIFTVQLIKKYNPDDYMKLKNVVHRIDNNTLKQWQSNNTISPGAYIGVLSKFSRALVYKLEGGTRGNRTFGWDYYHRLFQEVRELDI